MKITYDKQADAAYVMITDRIHDGEAATQLHLIETPGGKGEVTLDFDRNGKLLGMEILGAEKSFSLKSWRVLSRWRPIQRTAPTDLGPPNTIRYRPHPMGPAGPGKASLHARPTGQSCPGMTLCRPHSLAKLCPIGLVSWAAEPESSGLKTLGRKRTLRRQK